MIMTVKLFGLLIILLSAWGLMTPKSLIALVLGVWKRPWGIYFAVAVRIGLGILFVMAADQTRYPEAFRILGYLMIFVAAAILVTGRERLDKFMRWWQEKSPVFIRSWLIFGLLFGVFIYYAAS